MIRRPLGTGPRLLGPRRDWLGRARAADAGLLTRVAAADSVILDHALPRLSQAANHSVLWMAIAMALGATRNKWARRAAMRGLASIAIASSTTNVVAKGITRRQRPTHDVPLVRQLLRVPRSTSFPSGHAASAAAFATGVALEMPVLAAPIGALAAAVGASRVAVGVHYPSDVLAGFAIGTAAGTLTLRWWPRRPMRPADAVRPRHPAPASSNGEGLVLALNMAAGGTSPELAGKLRADLPGATIIEIGEGEDLAEELRKAMPGARIVGVAGGDGTIGTAADLALTAALPLLVIPTGTFNNFATDLGVISPDDALTALRSGDAVQVDVGVAGHKPFLNTSTTGVYVDLVDARDRLEKRIGKWPALLVALVHVLRDSQPQEIVVDGRRRRLWLLFAGNCGYAPAGFAPSYRPDLADGMLDVRIVDARPPFARVRLLAAVAMGTLGRSHVYRTWQADAVDLRATDGGPIHVSLDGEVALAGTHIRLAKRPAHLLVYRQADSDGAGG